MRPSPARITLCALISRWSRPAPCTADTARQSSETDLDHLGSAEYRLLLEELLLQRVAANEFHPEADPVANLLGPVNGDHIRMAHPGEQSAFVDD